MRHVQVAKAAQGKIIAWLQALDRKELTPQDAARWYDLATKIERLALGEVTGAVRQEQSGASKVILEVIERIVAARGEAATAAGAELRAPTGGADTRFPGGLDGEVLKDPGALGRRGQG
jgi:hypothetical protein